MLFTRLPSSVKALAPAKLNLFLEVLSRREDGFHEIETLMTAVSIFDTLRFEARDDTQLLLSCQQPLGQRAAGTVTTLMGQVPVGSGNLVVQALELVRRQAGEPFGAHVHLIKRIPSMAGLGGASSDAAAALRAANLGWNLNWSENRLRHMAAELGSDVPFFLHPTAAICRGRGEEVESIETSGSLHVVIARPPAGLATPEVYRNCQVADQPVAVSPVRGALQQGDAVGVGRHLHNRLQPAAAKLSPWIDRLRDAFNRLCCLGHQMSGSGTSYFGICHHSRHARRVAACLRSEGCGLVTVARTLGSPSHGLVA
jgi:4-diphosphocytidyl-2-C-methyl-D-erythritol kinase